MPDLSYTFTNSAIPPGDSLTYEIPTNHPGTYWVHGHHHGQYVDGLRTPLIIHPLSPHPSSKRDEVDLTVVLSDWFNKEHPVLLKEFLNPESTQTAFDS